MFGYSQEVVQLFIAEGPADRFATAVERWRAEAAVEEALREAIESRRRSRLRGLFKAIVFWLVPARRRAAAKVFHPARLERQGYFDTT